MTLAEFITAALLLTAAAWVTLALREWRESDSRFDEALRAGDFDESQRLLDASTKRIDAMRFLVGLMILLVVVALVANP